MGNCPIHVNYDSPPELYHGRTTQVEGRASLSRSWLYELLRRERKQGGDLYTGLPRQGRKYRKRLPSDASSSKIPNRIDLDQRPPVVDARNAPGHWEMDTIIGHGHQGVLLTAIERYSRLTRILVLPHRQAQFIAIATLEMLMPYQQWVHTITVDNGPGICRTRLCCQSLERPVLLLQTVPLLATRANRTPQWPGPTDLPEKAILPPLDPSRNRSGRATTQSDAPQMPRLPNTPRSLRFDPSASATENVTRNNQNTIRLVVN